jgi:hypothetical protein
MCVFSISITRYTGCVDEEENHVEEKKLRWLIPQVGMKDDMKERVFCNEEKFEDGLYVNVVLFNMILGSSFVKAPCPECEEKQRKKNSSGKIVDIVI